MYLLSNHCDGCGHLRVLNVNNILDQETGGGTAERTFQMSRYLARAGVDCSVLTSACGLSAERLAGMPGVAVTALPCLNRRFQLPRISLAKIDQLVKVADVIHLMNHWTVLNALTYRAIRKHGKPYVVCPAGALPIFGRSRLIKQVYNTLVGRRIIARADRFIAVTASEIPHYLAYGGHRERAVVIPNGISADDFRAKDDQGFRQRFNLPDKPIILFVGRITGIKGPDLLLQAFLRLGEDFSTYHLVFAGPDGGLLAELKKIAANHPAGERVHFTGFLAGAEKSSAYHAASLLVIPSRQEAMSIVAVEAGICGTPVLLTDQCGFSQVEDVGGGLVVPASEEGLAAGLRQLLANAEALPAMGERLRRYVCQDFLWEDIASRYISLYELMLSEARNR